MSGRAAKLARRAEAADQPAPRTLVAQRWATYRGDHGDSLRTVVGPNTLGEHMVSVDCDYDPATDRSRIGFAFLPKRTRR